MTFFHTHTHIHICVYVLLNDFLSHTHTHTHTNIYIYVLLNEPLTHTHAHICVYVLLNEPLTHTYTHTHLGVYVLLNEPHTYTHTHTYIYIYVLLNDPPHTYTHTSPCMCYWMTLIYTCPYLCGYVIYETCCIMYTCPAYLKIFFLSWYTLYTFFYVCFISNSLYIFFFNSDKQNKNNFQIETLVRYYWSGKELRESNHFTKLIW